MKALLLAGIAALAVATSACTDDKKVPVAGAPQAEDGKPVEVASAPQVPSTTASVDWAAARADLAKRPADIVVPQAAGSDPLVVPMLLPGNIAQTQGVNDRPTAPRTLKDGYVANYHLPRYDVIVNGTAKSYAVGTQAPATDKSEMKFQTSEGAAQLAFSRYGADYLIEFECREIDSPEGCITEAEAKELAEGLFVAQSR